MLEANNIYNIACEDGVKGIADSSIDEGALVLDCFSGSGSTAVACMKTNRDFIGFEIDEEYYNDSIKRIEQERDLFTF